MARFKEVVMFDNLFVLAGPAMTAAMLLGTLAAVVGICSTGARGQGSERAR